MPAPRSTDKAARPARRRAAGIRFEDAAGILPYGLLLLDGRGRAVFCNGEFRRLLALPPNESDGGWLLSDYVDRLAREGALLGEPPCLGPMLPWPLAPPAGLLGRT